MLTKMHHLLTKPLGVIEKSTYKFWTNSKTSKLVSCLFFIELSNCCGIVAIVTRAIVDPYCKYSSAFAYEASHFLVVQAPTS